MQIKTSLMLSLCLFVSSTFAAVPAAKPVAGRDDFSPPVPLSVTPPIRPSAGYENAIVTVKLVVDARGLPQHVETVGLIPVETRELVESAVKQWTFRPATRNGVPVSTHVILPLKLVTADT